MRAAIDPLEALPYRTDGSEGRARTTGRSGALDEQTVFRGSSPGADVGPYQSQFLLIGTGDQTGTAGLHSGLIRYSALQIDQRVPVAGHATG